MRLLYFFVGALVVGVADAIQCYSCTFGGVGPKECVTDPDSVATANKEIILCGHSGEDVTTLLTNKDARVKRTNYSSHATGYVKMGTSVIKTIMTSGQGHQPPAAQRHMYQQFYSQSGLYYQPFC
ncbi:unnamed protein product [Owenia fusiformis]|uniref:Secreted protein n=1 Tax=Owenia fusiformis TaxID=6347 RepID=A0A8S4NRW4_OWEFU|nr:unnamed protein product [Owenia fusiformis]